MRPQLMEDMYDVKPDYRLTPRQEGLILAVTRPQLRQDLYLSMIGQAEIEVSQVHRLPSREMD